MQPWHVRQTYGNVWSLMVWSDPVILFSLHTVKCFSNSAVNLFLPSKTFHQSFIGLLVEAVFREAERWREPSNFAAESQKAAGGDGAFLDSKLWAKLSESKQMFGSIPLGYHG